MWWGSRTRVVDGQLPPLLLRSVAGLKDTQPVVIRAIRCSGNALHHSPR